MGFGPSGRGQLGIADAVHEKSSEKNNSSFTTVILVYFIHFCQVNKVLNFIENICKYVIMGDYYDQFMYSDDLMTHSF